MAKIYYLPPRPGGAPVNDPAQTPAREVYAEAIALAGQMLDAAALSFRDAADYAEQAGLGRLAEGARELADRTDALALDAARPAPPAGLDALARALAAHGSRPS